MMFVRVMHQKFLSTPSARRATLFQLVESPVCAISIHALREEGDGPCAGLHRHRLDFYPRPPRGGRLIHNLKSDSLKPISIHALREEGDNLHRQPCARRRYFYPRPPRGGRP